MPSGWSSLSALAQTTMPQVDPRLIALALVLLPIAVAGIAFATPSNRWRPWLIPLGGLAQLGLVSYVLSLPGPLSAFDRWLELDPAGRLFLGYITTFFFLCSLYAPAYLAQRSERPNRVLCSCVFLSLSMMTLVILSHHLGLMWVAMEATTLFTAPSLYFNHNARSLEATWKYLVIGSVGIALALLGSFFLAYAALKNDLHPTLLFDELVKIAPDLSPPWLHAAFVLLFVGYGTKMGLAPMHTWKPDAYGEAPGMIGALMAGGMTNCAFFAILRYYEIASYAHDAQFVQQIMIFMGLFSMGVAVVFMVRQRDLKRLLAYSSVEHMGILIFGVGIGGAGLSGSLWHVIHNGMTKGVLFLAAANIHRAYGSKFTGDLKGVLRRLPFSGAMFLAGFFAITGSPLFAPFVSEFQILTAAFAGKHYLAGGLFALAMFAVFTGMGATVISMLFGKPSEAETPAAFHDRVGTGLPILLFMLIVIILGVYNPPQLTTAVEQAARALDEAP